MSKNIDIINLHKIGINNVLLYKFSYKFFNIDIINLNDIIRILIINFLYHYLMRQIWHTQVSRRLNTIYKK